MWSFYRKWRLPWFLKLYNFIVKGVSKTKSLVQTDATLLNVTCCVRLARSVACCCVLLGVVAQSLKPCKRTQQLPTMLNVQSNGDEWNWGLISRAFCPNLNDFSSLIFWRLSLLLLSLSFRHTWKTTLKSQTLHASSMETARGKLGCIIYAQLIRLVFTLDSQKFNVESTNFTSRS